MEGLLKQSTAVNVTVLMIDGTAHILGKTGLTLTIYATKGAGTPTVITPTVTELDSTNAPGLYKLALTTGHTDTLGELQLHITSSGADPTDLKWQVSARLIDDLAFPATSGRSMVVDAAGLVDANAVKVGPSGSGTAQTARDVGASVLLSAGSGAGQLDFTSGVVKANLAQILGTALTETAGQIAAAFKKFFNIATPASTMDALTLVATATNLTNAPTSGDFTAAMKTSIGTAVAASAVASVTGNVGGNVVGSVGSVTGAVGSVTGLTASDVGAIKTQTDKMAFTVTNQIDANVLDWKSATAPAMTGDAYARLGAPAGASVSADIAAVKTVADAVKAKTDNLTSAPADETLIIAATDAIMGRLGSPAGASVSADVAAVKSDTGAIKAKTDNLPASPAAVSDIPTAANNADAVWEEAIADHSGTSGSTAEALAAAGSAGDPWLTALPGSYGAGTAGKIIGDNIDATVSSRTKPADTQAAVTLVTTTTNLTNAPTSGDFTATMKTSLSAATPAVTVSDKTGFSLTSAYDAAKTAAQVSDIPDKNGYRLSSTGVNDLLRTVLTEGYAADGSPMTLEQAVHMIWSILAERTLTGTTLQTKQIDGSSNAMAFTLDDATTPTSQTRSA